ncbi:MAG: hypothetical protein V1776_03845 [Candidatus Diapherotrites archaeon]
MNETERIEIQANDFPCPECGKTVYRTKEYMNHGAIEDYLCGDPQCLAYTNPELSILNKLAPKGHSRVTHEARYNPKTHVITLQPCLVTGMEIQTVLDVVKKMDYEVIFTGESDCYSDCFSIKLWRKNNPFVRSDYAFLISTTK